MEDKLQQLKTILAKVSDLNATAALLEWDQQTYMPPGGALGRGYQLATVSSLAHENFTSAQVGQLLEDLKPFSEELDPDSDDARLIKVTNREYQKYTKVPSSYVAEFKKLTTMAHPVWESARAENDLMAMAHKTRHLGDVYRQKGLTDRAIQYYLEALSLYRNHQDPPKLDYANAIQRVAITKEESSQTVEAKKLWEEAKELYAMIGLQEGVDYCSRRIANLSN